MLYLFLKVVIENFMCSMFVRIVIYSFVIIVFVADPSDSPVVVDGRAVMERKLKLI